MFFTKHIFYFATAAFVRWFSVRLRDASKPSFFGPEPGQIRTIDRRSMHRSRSAARKRLKRFSQVCPFRFALLLSRFNEQFRKPRSIFRAIPKLVLACFDPGIASSDYVVIGQDSVGRILTNRDIFREFDCADGD